MTPRSQDDHARLSTTLDFSAINSPLRAVIATLRYGVTEARYHMLCPPSSGLSPVSRFRQSSTSLDGEAYKGSTLDMILSQPWRIDDCEALREREGRSTRLIRIQR